MEQNTQPIENNTEIRLNNGDEPNSPKLNKKIILLIIIVLIIVSAGAAYFLFFNKEDNNSLFVEDNKEVKIDKELDTDQDGFPDYMEKIIGTDENNLDTDGDTYGDFEEIKNGYNPLDNKKYTEKEWKTMKEKIKNEDDEFFGEMFGGSDKTIDDCDAFPNKLDLCESFSCKFEHPFTGEIMEKKIIGLVNGKCQYTEEMPNNGKMDCEYSESLRKAVAQYHRDLVIAESAETIVEADLENSDIKITYTIDGKEVENPLQEATTNGQCIISGYKKLQVDDKKNNTLNNKPTSQVTLDSIKFEKDSYSLGSSARAIIRISYEGGPFYGLMLLKMSRDGFSGHKGTHIYSSYVKLIDGDTTINKPVAFTYSNGVISWPSETSIYENEGKHTYEFLLFDCNSIINEFSKECDEIEFGTDVFDDGLPKSNPLDIEIVSIDIVREK